jgi:hypothetical protein
MLPLIVFPKPASQDASEEYNQLKIKNKNFHLSAFDCFLKSEEFLVKWDTVMTM